MSQISWFSHSWNNSLFSLPFKFFLKRESTLSDMLFLKDMGYILSFTGFMVYLFILVKKKLCSKRQFTLTVCFMFLISPLAWLYYLPILFIPAIFLLAHFNQMNNKEQQCLIASIFYPLNIILNYLYYSFIAYQP